MFVTEVSECTWPELTVGMISENVRSVSWEISFFDESGKHHSNVSQQVKAEGVSKERSRGRRVRGGVVLRKVSPKPYSSEPLARSPPGDRTLINDQHPEHIRG